MHDFDRYRGSDRTDRTRIDSDDGRCARDGRTRSDYICIRRVWVLQIHAVVSKPLGVRARVYLHGLFSFRDIFKSLYGKEVDAL